MVQHCFFFASSAQQLGIYLGNIRRKGGFFNRMLYSSCSGVGTVFKEKMRLEYLGWNGNYCDRTVSVMYDRYAQLSVKRQYCFALCISVCNSYFDY